MSMATLPPYVILLDNSRQSLIRFEVLSRGLFGAGFDVERCTTDSMALIKARTLGAGQSVVVVGTPKYVQLEYLYREDWASQYNTLTGFLRQAGVPEDQIIFLNNIDTPEDVEQKVRECIFQRLQSLESSGER